MCWPVFIVQYVVCTSGVLFSCCTWIQVTHTACAFSFAGFKSPGNSAHLTQSRSLPVRFGSAPTISRGGLGRSVPAVWSGCLLIGRSPVKEQVMVNFNGILDLAHHQWTNQAQWSSPRYVFMAEGLWNSRGQPEVQWWNGGWAAARGKENLRQRTINLSTNSGCRPSLKTFYFIPSPLISALHLPFSFSLTQYLHHDVLDFLSLSFSFWEWTAASGGWWLGLCVWYRHLSSIF